MLSPTRRQQYFRFPSSQTHARYSPGICDAFAYARRLRIFAARCAWTLLLRPMHALLSACSRHYSHAYQSAAAFLPSIFGDYVSSNRLLAYFSRSRHYWRGSSHGYYSSLPPSSFCPWRYRFSCHARLLGALLPHDMLCEKKMIAERALALFYRGGAYIPDGRHAKIPTRRRQRGRCARRYYRRHR